MANSNNFVSSKLKLCLHTQWEIWGFISGAPFLQKEMSLVEKISRYTNENILSVTQTHTEDHSHECQLNYWQRKEKHTQEELISDKLSRITSEDSTHDRPTARARRRICTMMERPFPWQK